MAKKSPDKVPEEPQQQSTAVGRPSSFDPDYLRQAEFLCGHGAATDEELAEFFQVAKRTINRWKVMHPEFVEAIKRGKDAADDRVVNSLYHKAMERETEEEQAIKLKTVTYGDNGKRLKEEERVEIVTVKKLIPADTTAMIFWLKNRRSKDWRDVHKIEHGKAGAFDHMDDNELEEFIVTEVKDITPTALPLPSPEPKAKNGRAKH